MAVFDGCCGEGGEGGCGGIGSPPSQCQSLLEISMWVEHTASL